jgi:hypothetical protein
MDTAYITWIVLIGGGALLAAFVKPKRIIVWGAALTACALAGLVISSILGGGNFTVVCGVAAMAIPVVFAMLAIGAWVGAALRGSVRRNRSGS